MEDLYFLAAFFILSLYLTVCTRVPDFLCRKVLKKSYQFNLSAILFLLLGSIGKIHAGIFFEEDQFLTFLAYICAAFLISFWGHTLSFYHHSKAKTDILAVIVLLAFGTVSVILLTKSQIKNPLLYISVAEVISGSAAYSVCRFIRKKSLTLSDMQAHKFFLRLYGLRW